MAAAAKAYVVQILDNTNSQLEKTLPAFFGKGDLGLLEELYGQLMDSGIIFEEAPASSMVGKV